MAHPSLSYHNRTPLLLDVHQVLRMTCLLYRSLLSLSPSFRVPLFLCHNSTRTNLPYVHNSSNTSIYKYNIMPPDRFKSLAYTSRISGDQAGLPGLDGGGDGGASQRNRRRTVDLEYPGAYRRPTESSPVE